MTQKPTNAPAYPPVECPHCQGSIRWNAAEERIAQLEQERDRLLAAVDDISRENDLVTACRKARSHLGFSQEWA